MPAQVKRNQAGFTLVEIAIVLVVIGLLVGGVLKGQEMINNAKVRNTISGMEGIKTAIFAFQDRFRAMPGDMSNANAMIGGIAVNCTWQCDNGLIQPWRNTSLVTNNLSAAGLYSGNFATAELNAVPTAQNAAANPWGGPMFTAYYNQFNATGGVGTETANGVYTGRSIPSKFLAEIDRKVDDGLPQTGSFRSAYPVATSATCVNGNTWVTNNGGSDCAGVNLF